MEIINGNNPGTITLRSGKQELHFEFSPEVCFVSHTFKYGCGLRDHFKASVMSPEEVLDLFMYRSKHCIVVKTPTGNVMEINQDIYNKIVSTLNKAVKKWETLWRFLRRINN